MANPTYTVKVLKVDATAIDLELKTAFDPYVYCWPSLPVRALADGPGSPLSAFDLSTREGVGVAAAAWVEQVEILATRRGIGQYRVCARKPGLGDKLKKGATWTSSAMHVDDHRYGQGTLAAGGKLLAVVVDPGSVVACGAVELLAVTKKGPGATKGWLNHVGVQGVGALDGRILSWSPDRVRIWDEATRLLEEHSAAVTCACLTSTGLAIGTHEGLILDGETLSLGPVTALSWAGEKLHVLVGSGEVVVLSGKTEAARFQAVPGTMLAVAGDDVAISADDLQVYWYRKEKLLGTVEGTCYEGLAIHDTADLPGGVLVGGLREVALVYADGRMKMLPARDLGTASAAGGLFLTTAHGDVARSRIWSEAGAWLGEVVLPRSTLHRAQLTVRLPSTRLTWDGAWVLCAEQEHEKGCVRLVGTRGQGQVRFPHPNAHYDFVTDVEQVGPESFLIGYGNWNATLWNLDGSSRDLGFRLDCIWYGHGRILTSKDNEVTERDAGFGAVGSFKVDVPYGLHWMEASVDGRFVVLGAQPRAWVQDLKTGEQWEIVQEEGGNDPSFAGHAHYFTTTGMDSKKSFLRIWDALSRRVVMELSDLRATRRVRWLSDTTLLTTGYEGVLVIDVPSGGRRSLLAFPEVAQVRARPSSIGFDRKGQLLTHGERSHLYAWQRPGDGKSHGGYYGPSVLEVEPGWCITLGQWPARAMRMPG